MGGRELLPKGGFLRGVLAGTAFSAIIVIALSAAFDSASVAPDIPDEPAPVIIPPSDPVATAPVFGSGSAAPVVSNSPAAVSVENPASDAFATQETSAQPTPSNVQPPVMSIEVTEPVTNQPGNNEGPAIAESTPAVDAPVIAAESTIETNSTNITAPVGMANSGFNAPSVGDAAVSGLSGGNSAPQLPTIGTPAQLGASSVAQETAPQTTASAAQPSGGFTMNGQTIIAPTTDEPQVAQTGEGTDDHPPFEANAQDFGALGGKPALSIILVANTMAEANAAAALSSPVVLAVSPETPEAAAILVQYRAQGGEALLLLPTKGAHSLRSGMEPIQASANLVATLSNISGVIGIVDGPEGDLPGDATLLAEVLLALGETGHGLVTTNAVGLNRAEIMAQEAGVPAASIVRQIDTQPGKIPVIRQMDKTVLEMGADGSAVVYGHASSDVLAALKFWLKSNKASRVSIAPVSVIMQENR